MKTYIKNILKLINIIRKYIIRKKLCKYRLFKDLLFWLSCLAIKYSKILYKRNIKPTKTLKIPENKYININNDRRYAYFIPNASYIKKY